MLQKRKSAVNPSVHARVVERYLFNFRLSPKALDNHLSVDWLRPQILNGKSVVSFCMLKLENLALKPLPSFLGLNTISCAYRCGVIDASGEVPEPSVYVVSRNTDLPIISRLAPIVFSGAMHMIRTDIVHSTGGIDISATYPDGRRLFSARVRPSSTPEKIDSQLFNSLGAFVSFIKDGVSSYTPSTRPGSFSRLDLKEDTVYESVDATVTYSLLDREWQDARLVFDSAVRAKNRGHYTWTYRGQVCRQTESTFKGRKTAISAS